MRQKISNTQKNRGKYVANEILGGFKDLGNPLQGMPVAEQGYQPKDFTLLPSSGIADNGLQ